MMDLTGEVSSGAVDLAKTNLENMLTMCAKAIEGDEELKTMQKKSFHDVTHELVRRVTSPNTTVREQVWLQSCACIRGGGGGQEAEEVVS